MNSSDVGEIHDIVRRKGPLTYHELMAKAPPYAPDEVFEALEELEADGKVRRREDRAWVAVDGEWA